MDKLCAIILDVQMPKRSGLEVLRIISRQGVTERIPTFLITAQDDEALVSQAYSLGVMDVVNKPVAAIVIQKRIKTVIELFATRESLRNTVAGQKEKLTESAHAIEALHRSTIEALATAIEFRDVESGSHVNRIYGITKYILTHTAFGQGLSDTDIENMAQGAIMHDIGKIAISDVILNKPGKLTKEEFEIMKTHTSKGADLLEQVCRNQSIDVYRYAMDIARHHHERWDGRGYPDGLKGNEISVASQAVSIADVYDALISDRIYKKAFDPETAVNMIVRGDCGVFNPQLLSCFLAVEPVLRQWYLSDNEDAMEKSLGQPPAHIPSDPVQRLHEVTASDSVTDLMLLNTAVQTAFDMIIVVNLTKNTFRMVDYDRFGTHCVGYDGVFDDLIQGGATSVPVSHREEFCSTFCRENLLKAYHEGRKSVRLEHPQYADDGTLHWVLTKVLFMQDGRSGDILQITLSQYIDREHAEQEQARKLIAEALSLAGLAGEGLSMDVVELANVLKTAAENRKSGIFLGGGNKTVELKELAGNIKPKDRQRSGPYRPLL